MNRKILKNKAIDLRQKGKTYGQICNVLGCRIPKSTLSWWLKDINLSVAQKQKIRKENLKHLNRIRKIVLAKKKFLRKKYFQAILAKNKGLKSVAKQHEVAKIMLAMLYWCEGCRYGKGALMFGNSDPEMIKLFLRLLRQVYCIDENKLRCTVQCRYGQDIVELQRFWAKITDISSGQFYPTVIDERTKNKPLKKKDYKGVCRINYFSADVYHELTTIPKIFYNF